MHIYNLDKWMHEHSYSIADSQAERNTWRVIILTLVMMVLEIIGGLVFGSMSLLADGWHMGTHVAALGITVFAYWYSRKHKDDSTFAFGTGKVGVLGGFASAVVLGVVAFLMVVESIERLLSPVEIKYLEAIGVAVLGLIVNLISALMLKHHDYSGEDEVHDHHKDHNLKAAYLHVLADAMTSVFAIAALLSGKLFGWSWLDPFVGIIGAAVISLWAYGLICATGKILLDSDVSKEFLTSVKDAIEADSDNKVVDLHVWKTDAENFAALVSLVTHYPKDIDYYRNLLSGFTKIRHVTFEVNQGPGEPCVEIDGDKE